MMTAREVQAMRRRGYRLRAPRLDPVLALLVRAGVRPRPLNREHPLDGHWIAACPWCSAEDVLYVEPDGKTWSTRCTCSPGGGLLELHAALLVGALAA